MAENRKPKFFYGYIIVSAGFAILVALQGMLSSFGIFFEPILEEFGWTRAVTSGAFSLTLVLSGFLGMGAGKLNDRFGPKLLVTVGGFFLGLGYILMSQISAIWQLYLFFGVIVAIGISTLPVPLLSTVARWFVRRRGMMTGIVSAGTGIGLTIMPPIASWLIISYGWRTSFIAIGIIPLVLIILAAQFLKRNPQSIGQLPDGEIEIKQEGSNLEARGLSLREAIHTRQFWMLWVTFFCLGFPTSGILVHIVIHATGLGIPALIAASILTVIGVVSTLGRVIMGSAGDRIGNRSALIISLILVSIALLWLLVVKEVWMLYLFAAIFGLAHSAIVLMSPMVAELFGLISHGVLTGIIATGLTIGGAIGPVLVGHIFDITGSYQLGFLICAAASIIGLIPALLLKPTTSEGGKNDSERNAGLY